MCGCADASAPSMAGGAKKKPVAKKGAKKAAPKKPVKKAPKKK
jgi:hypothetical protein